MRNFSTARQWSSAMTLLHLPLLQSLQMPLNIVQNIMDRTIGVLNKTATTTTLVTTRTTVIVHLSNTWDVARRVEFKVTAPSTVLNTVLFLAPLLRHGHLLHRTRTRTGVLHHHNHGIQQPMQLWSWVTQLLGYWTLELHTT